MPLASTRLDELTAPGSPRVYSGDELARIAMPVGGILAGQLYFKGDGSLAHWDIMNGRAFGSSPLVRPAAALQQGFAVRVRNDAGQVVSFPLTHDVFSSTTFTADYPAGVVSYKGAKSLPLSVTLEGIAPFVPLDTAASAIPAAFLRVTLRNTTSRTVEGDLLGWLENGTVHLSGLSAEEGSRIASARETSGALAVEFAASPSTAGRAGGAKARAPILLADFETTDDKGWKSRGEAFGIGPVDYESLPEGGPKGRAGKACASSLPSGPAATGTLESPEFVIERNSLRFLLAGPKNDANLRVELRCGDEILLSSATSGSDTLTPVVWDLRPHAGKKVRLVVTDASETGGLVFDQAELFDEKLGPVYGRPDFGTMAFLLLDSPAASIYVQYADEVKIRSNRFTATHHVLGQSPRFRSVIQLQNINQAEILGLNTVMAINRTNADMSALIGTGSKVTGLKINAGIAVSSDLDLLPDWWETQYFGNPTAATADADPDGDGLTSYMEYLAQLNPWRRDGISVTPDYAGSQPVLRWTPVGDRFITIYATESLTSPFNVLVQDIPGELGAYNLPPIPPGGRVFYKLGITD